MLRMIVRNIQTAAAVMILKVIVMKRKQWRSSGRPTMPSAQTKLISKCQDSMKNNQKQALINKNMKIQ